MAVNGSWAGECGECGWTIYRNELPEELTVESALEKHADKYCARPAPYNLNRL